MVRVNRRNTPSVSRFEQGRGWRGWWWSVDRETTLLRLAFRGREGVDDGGGVSIEKIPPPSRVSSEGGGVEMVVVVVEC